MRTDLPAMNTRSTDKPASCGNKMLRTLRSHARHDHKNDDQDTTRHAAPATSRKVGQSHNLAVDTRKRPPLEGPPS
jgi:hypothetical protein